MKIRPLADRVLVRPEEMQTKTAGGIIIPDTAQEKTQKAVVVAVGSDKDRIKVAVGEKIIHDKYVGSQIQIEGVEHLILKSTDIIAVIE